MEHSLYGELHTLFMCKTCSAVLGEGASVCGSNETLGVVAFLRVTNDVILNEKRQIGMDYSLEGCIYHILKCKDCDSIIGFNLCSATRPYTHLRGLFCLLKTEIMCYFVKSKTMIEGLNVKLDFQMFINHITELKVNLVEMSNRVEELQFKIAGHQQDALVKLKI